MEKLCLNTDFMLSSRTTKKFYTEVCAFVAFSVIECLDLIGTARPVDFTHKLNAYTLLTGRRVGSS